VTRPRAADDFTAIRAHMEELRRERESTQAAETHLQRDPPDLPRPKRALARRRDQYGEGTGRPIELREAARSRQALVGSARVAAHQLSSDCQPALFLSVAPASTAA
jgi:hypothetical protein